MTALGFHIGPTTGRAGGKYVSLARATPQQLEEVLWRIAQELERRKDPAPRRHNNRERQLSLLAQKERVG